MMRPPSSNSCPCLHRLTGNTTVALPLKSAFTLIELLVGITIIAILVSITIPGLSKARTAADDVQCKSVMRQWGQAMQLYLHDNDGRLPGPCYTGQGRGIDPAPTAHDFQRRSLFNYIAPYASLVVTEKSLIPESMICRSWLRNTPMKGTDGVVYFLGINGGPIYPYGYSQWSPPWQYVDALADERISETIALVDCDGEYIAGWDDRSPARPVHGNHRNVLHWDWHVGTMPVNNSN